MTNIYIVPEFNENDYGGIARVVEAQRKYLPKFGYNIVDSLDKADIVATHGVFHVKYPCPVPVVNHCHGQYWSDEVYKWDPWAHKANLQVLEAFRNSDVATAPSEWVARIMRRKMWLEAPVLYHGVEPDEWVVGSKEHPFVLWNKTRVDPICETDTLNELSRLAPEIAFVSTFGAPANNIKLTGALPYDQAQRLVQESSVYLCSARETFGIGTLEAMLCETPILGWDFGGQREIVEHKVTGWLARPGDFNSLLEGLHYCLENRAILGRRAREHVLENFTWQIAMQKYADLYNQVLAEQHKPRDPKVSVIITCYNLAESLPRAVESVKKQSLSDFEIVIVNDASPDDTLAVAKKLQKTEKRIRIVNNKENLYLAGALNAGIEAARGKYIVPLDADNELGENALEILAHHLDNGWLNPYTKELEHVDIAYGKMRVINEDGTQYVSGWPQQFKYADQMAHKNQITSTSMYRKRIWSRIGGYRRRCRTAEDADFWTRATTYGARARKVTDVVVLVYHDRPGSMSNTEKDWPWHLWYQPNTNEIFTGEPTRITVVIPVGPGHNELVVDALDSVAAQTYRNWDCIVINDSGSPIKWLPPFARLIETSGKLGPAVARNVGIAACKTQFWIPLDADDYLQPETLEILLKHWEKGTYVYSDWIKQETGEVHKTSEFNCRELVRYQPNAVTALYEHEMWINVGGFDEELKAWEDWDFILSLASKGYCGRRVPLPLFQYRMSSGNRREALYAERETHKAEIAKKWHKFIVEGEPLMACGGCGKRAPVVQSYHTSASVSNHVNGNGNASSIKTADSDALVMVEYQGVEATRTYRGPVSGVEYRFGKSSPKKYVRAIDIEFFKLRPEFKVDVGGGNLVTTVQPPLQAVGPPTR